MNDYPSIKRGLIETCTKSGTIYQKKELIGYGSHASVYRYVNMSTGKNVSIKIYVYPQVYRYGWRSKLHQQESFLRQEIYLMCSIQHPNILACTDMYYRREYRSIDFGIVSEMATCDFTALLKSRRVNVDSRRNYMQQFLTSITFLHKCGYLHCDLKLCNLLYYQETDNLKLADFGMCLSRTKYKKGDIRLAGLHCSPVSTRAPELLDHSYVLRTEYKEFWLALPEGLRTDPSIDDIYKCECYSIGHVLLELYLWRDVEIFESKELWGYELERRILLIRSKYLTCTVEQPFQEDLEHTIASLMDLNPETRLTKLDIIPWKVDVEGNQRLPSISSLPIEYKEEIKKGIHYLYIDLVRRRERIYTLGQVLGLYYRILSSNPLLIFQTDKVAICSINLVTIKKTISMGDEQVGMENMDYVMELMLNKFLELDGLIYTSTIDTLTEDSYLAWKSLTYYVEPELMMEYTPSKYFEIISPSPEVKRIDFHSDLLTYVSTYGELC